MLKPTDRLLIPGLVADAIAEKTQAIIPVHMCGRSAGIRLICKIAQR
jgi:dTDP-4-amino-4,6-dideoxygalactose transaminase